MKKHLLCILICLASGMVHKAYSQGLQFYGNEERIAERSSFQVFTKEYIPVAIGRFTISFEYAIHNDKSPGYILYLKNADGEEAFNLTYVYENSKGSFMFAQDGKQIYYTAEYDNSNLHGKWMPASLDMDIANNRAEIIIGNSKAVLNDIGLKGKRFTPQLFFGMCNHILETASFSIRNLVVSNGEETWNFPLNESQGEEVHDSKGNLVGQITNPVWLINYSYYWKPLLQHSSLTPSGFAFAPLQQRFYIYNRDSVMNYNIYDHTLEHRSYAPKGKQLPIRLGMNFMDESKGVIYPYEMNWKETYVAEMHPETGNWKTVNRDAVSLQLHHHCGLHIPQKQQFLFFGGYGNRQYYNTFLTYDLAQNSWDTLHFAGDVISPRFFAGAAMTPDGKYAYIYGGKGNEVGDQNVGIQYYYDCYRLDFENNRIKKLWEHEEPSFKQVPARNMILSEDGNYLYLLAYPEYKPQTFLQLYRLSLADGSYEALGDSIPMTSEEIATNANLYFNPVLDEFYCVIQEFEKYGQSATRVYSLSNPPVSLAEVKYYDKRQELPSPNTFLWFYVFAAALLVVASGGIFIMIRRRKRLSNMPQPVDGLPSVMCGEVKSEKVESTVPEEFPLPDVTIIVKKNSVSLFGTFTVIDRNGRDITYMFSPKIRHLFLYILINSITRDGVLSADLNSLFWPDKPDDKIKNLKNVTMNHLRKTLQELDGIELTHQKGYFKLLLGEECYCDYQRFFVLTGGMKRIPSVESEVKELYGIFAQGKLLHTMDNSLFDYVKQQTETFAIQLLSEQIHFLYKSGKDQATIYTCNTLLSIDPLSDTAIAYIVCTYRRQNKLDKALQCYTAFCKEYRQVMGENYPVVLEELDIEHIRL